MPFFLATCAGLFQKLQPPVVVAGIAGRHGEREVHARVARLDPVKFFQKRQRVVHAVHLQEIERALEHRLGLHAVHRSCLRRVPQSFPELGVSLPKAGL